ncbi:PhzF family phenazine biosynthesis protein [Curtobacterium sp. MCPF17_052]
MTGAGPTPAAGPAVYEARNLFPVGRITEDPATGSAAASVGAYLRAVGRASAGDRVVIRQGRHVGRPSLLLVDVPAAGGVTVTGGATPIR